MNSLMFSVMLLHEETSGLSFIGVLCIFFGKYSAAVVFCLWIVEF